jgi:hypothetical protein
MFPITRSHPRKILVPLCLFLGLRSSLEAPPAGFGQVGQPGTKGPTKTKMKTDLGLLVLSDLFFDLRFPPGSGHLLLQRRHAILDQRDLLLLLHNLSLDVDDAL